MGTPPIPIESELYFQVREFCNHNGIRFKDFVENAFESAMDHEGMMGMVEKASSLIDRVGRECQSAYQQGFRSGLLAGVLLAQGRVGIFKCLCPSEMLEKGNIFKPVKGSQRHLFDKTDK